MEEQECFYWVVIDNKLKEGSEKARKRKERVVSRVLSFKENVVMFVSSIF